MFMRILTKAVILTSFCVYLSVQAQEHIKDNSVRYLRVVGGFQTKEKIRYETTGYSFPPCGLVPKYFKNA